MKLRKPTNFQLAINIIISIAVVLNYAFYDWFNQVYENEIILPSSLLEFGLFFLGALFLIAVFILILAISIHIVWNYVVCALFETNEITWSISILASTVLWLIETFPMAI